MGAFHPSMGHCASEDQEITVNRCEELPKCSALLLQRGGPGEDAPALQPAPARHISLQMNTQALQLWDELLCKLKFCHCV